MKWDFGCMTVARARGQHTPVYAVFCKKGQPATGYPFVLSAQACTRSNTMKLFQAGNIIGHGGDLVVRHAAGDGVHRRAVLAGVRFRAAELGQLGYRIVLMLTGNARILHGYAIARRAMTAGTGGDLLASDATAVNLLAQVDSIFVLG